jgi:hypothetical protein
VDRALVDSSFGGRHRLERVVVDLDSQTPSWAAARFADTAAMGSPWRTAVG